MRPARGLLPAGLGIVVLVALVKLPQLPTPDAFNGAPPMAEVSGQASARFEALKRIPTADILQAHVLEVRTRYRFSAVDDDASLATVDPSDPASVLARFDAIQARGDARYFAFIQTLPAAERLLHLLATLLEQHTDDALHTFFYLSHTPATEVLGALKEAKLLEHAILFERAMALFGPIYPETMAQRKPHFAWSRPGRRIDEHTTIPNELNDFDRAMMAISQQFGVQTKYRTALETFIEGDEASRNILAATRANLSDDQRIDTIFRRDIVQINLQASPDSVDRELANFPEPYGAMLVLWIFQAEMLNGSIHQFFFNSSGVLAPLVVKAMLEAGLPKHAEVVERGIAMFKAPYERRTPERRKQHFAQGWTAWDDKLAALTDEIDDGAIQRAIIDLAKKHGVLPQ
jgi:hypothetical protein